MPESKYTPPTCGTCRFFDDNFANHHYGVCRRYAPKPNATQAADADTTWPVVSEGDWCGEHQSVPGGAAIDPVTSCRRVDLAADRLNRPTPAGTDSPSYISAMRDAGRR